MKIEHCAFQVDDPAAMARWYCENLDFQIKRSADQPLPVRFLADQSGQIMFELYNNPKMTTPNYQAMDPLLLHIAFTCHDIPAAVDRLIAAGASRYSGPETCSGDEMAMLRDPWGLAIQFVKRANPMI